MKLTTPRRIFDAGSDDYFEVGEHRIGVHSRQTIGIVSGMVYDLSVDGISASNGKPVLARRPMPWWVWIFVVYCVVVALYPFIVGFAGAAVNFLLGSLAAGACLVVATKPEWSTPIRVIFCLVVSLGSWILASLIMFFVLF